MLAAANQADGMVALNTWPNIISPSQSRIMEPRAFQTYLVDLGLEPGTEDFELQMRPIRSTAIVADKFKKAHMPTVLAGGHG
eukprot:scaffold461350_cov31-Prasinocladus_malaysianus.AAC.1